MTPNSLYIAASEVVATVHEQMADALRALRGPMGGEQVGIRRGAGMEFADHRLYAPGDDLKRLDWRAYARKDKLFIKQFDQSVHNNTLIVVDTSASMSLPDSVDGGDIDKWRQTQLLAAALLLLIDQADHRLGLLTLSSDRQQANAHSKPCRALIQTLSEEQPQGSADLTHWLNVDRQRQWANVVVLSDCLADPDQCVAPLVGLKRGGSNLCLVHTLHPLELDFSFQGAVKLACAETEQTLRVEPALIRSRYQSMMAKHCEDLRLCSERMGVQYCLADLGRNVTSLLRDVMISMRRGGLR
ncbi:MAG TPA: hypothetical protein DCQ06_07705 [Myxococcales bacterium]|nr:hypothetical protein [Myxococcales bacterium]